MSGIFTKYRTPIIIAIVGIALRVAFALGFADLEDENYWEYGHIAKNVLAGKGYSYFYLHDGKIDFRFDESANPVPSAYMPPGYAAFLTPFLTIKSVVLRNLLILFFQAFLSGVCIILLFRLTSILFKDDRIAFISAGIYALLPEFIYASNSYGPTIIFHLGILSALVLLYSGVFDYRRALGFAVLSGAPAYFRSEFFLLFVVFLALYFFRKKRKEAVLALAVGLFLVSPWLIRNYCVFDKFPLFTTNLGQNLYRGHNPARPGAWADSSLAKALNKVKFDKYYELRREATLKKFAYESINESYGRGLKFAAEKLFHLWIFNYYDARSFNPAYIVPQILLILTAFFGLVKTRSFEKFDLIYLYYLFYSALAIAFFAIARYQTMMKVALIPFSAWAIVWFYRRFRK